MVAARVLEHIGDKLCGNRCAALVFLVLAGVREKRDDCGDALGTGDLAGVDHDAELHEGRVDLTTASVDDVHIVLAHGFWAVGMRMKRASGSRNRPPRRASVSPMLFFVISARERGRPMLGQGYRLAHDQSKVHTGGR
jgi:hypothetical protein